MKNKILALLATIGLVASASAVEINENLSINGFIDGSYKMVDSDSGSDSQFLDLDEVELNFLLNVGNVSGTVNIDTDSGANDVDLEQAHFTYSMDNGVSFTFGHYGSALGFEREDPAGLYTFSRAYNDSAFNSGNIDADGNDITGLSVAFAGDSYSLAASLHEARDANLENEDLNLELSFAYTGVENFSIGGGYAWDNQQNSASEVDEMNLHVATNMGKIFLAAEYTQLMNDTADRDAYMLLADYDFNDKWGAALRISQNEQTGTDGDYEKITLAPNYSFTDSLGVILEYSDVTNDNVDTDEYAVELTYTF